MNFKNSLSRMGLALGLTFCLGLLFPISLHAQLHGGAIYKTPTPTNGTDRARVGELIRATITVENMDQWGDTLVITSVVDRVYHARGVSNSPNLLLSNYGTNQIFLLSPIIAPIELTSKVFTNYYRVELGDEDLFKGLLQDDAIAGGIDTFDATSAQLGRTLPALPFSLTFPGQVTIVGTNPTICISPQCALGAWSDPTYRPANKPPDRNQAFWARGISTNLVFYPEPGGWHEDPNGTAQLTGTLRSLTNLSSGFTVTMTLTGRTSNAPPGSPNLELDPRAYVQNGGPINPATWYYYPNFTGTLTGFGFWQGAVITFRRDPASSAFQVGIGANGKNTRFGATGWWNWTVVQQPASGNISAQTIVANINLDLICCSPSTLGDLVWQDLNKNGVQDNGEPGVPNVVVRLLDCTNRVVLTNTITDASGLYYFRNLVAGSYIVQFLPPTGYQFTQPFQGGDNTRDSDADPATGFSQCVILSTNDSNLTIDAGLITNCVPTCVFGAFSDPTYRPSDKPPGRNQAIWMKGISTNLYFTPDPGSWIERSDGTAQLTGIVRSLTNNSSGFSVVLNLSGRTANPPSGSPKLDLDPSAYIQNGGPLNPATWYYYPTSTATLTGFGFWQGASLSLARYGPAFQLGVGANGKNQGFGGSGWFTWTVNQQPFSGNLPTTGQADFNLDIVCCP